MANGAAAEELDKGTQPAPETPTPEGGKSVLQPPPGSGSQVRVEAPDPDEGLDEKVTEKNGKKFFTLSERAFGERISKESKKKLKEIFGTSDSAELMRWKKQYDEFQKDAEERKRSEMSERQKLESERDAALSKLEVAERRANAGRDYIERQKTQKRIESIAKEHVHRDKMDLAVAAFRSHLLGMSRHKIDKFARDKGAWGKWFGHLVSKNPELDRSGKPAEAASAPEAAPPKPKLKATNGVVSKDTPTPDAKASPAGANGKTAMNMSAKELREYAARNGVKIPGDITVV
jgi:hypothetical protein